MQTLRSAMLTLLMYLLMGVFGLLGAPVVLWSRDWTRRWMKLYIRTVLALTRIICGLRIELRGQAPRQAVIVAAKHQSMLDVLILFNALPEPRFVMKRSLVWAPVFGLYALRIGCIWIKREKRGEASTMMRRLQKTHSQTGQVVIYPQGTRVPPGTYKPYRRGAAMAYAEFGLPMVLAATNVGWFWPKKGITRRPGTAVLEFLETLPPGLPRAEVMQRMETSIEAASDRLGDEARLAIEAAGSAASAK
jgi:1-acyl-sn-glycerol-3-phosphate acyltransferase